MSNGAEPPICTVETLRVRYRNPLKACKRAWRPVVRESLGYVYRMCQHSVSAEMLVRTIIGGHGGGVPEGRATVISRGDSWERVSPGRLFGKFLVPLNCNGFAL